MTWVTWVHKILAWVKKMAWVAWVAWVEILALVVWVHNIGVDPNFGIGQKNGLHQNKMEWVKINIFQVFVVSMSCSFIIHYRNELYRPSRLAEARGKEDGGGGRGGEGGGGGRCGGRGRGAGGGQLPPPPAFKDP